MKFVFEFLLDDVVCSGGEKSLDECSHSAWGRENCGYDEHFYVTCGTGKALMS